MPCEDSPKRKNSETDASAKTSFSPSPTRKKSRFDYSSRDSRQDRRAQSLPNIHATDRPPNSLNLEQTFNALYIDNEKNNPVQGARIPPLPEPLQPGEKNYESENERYYLTPKTSIRNNSTPSNAPQVVIADSVTSNSTPPLQHSQLRLGLQQPISNPEMIQNATNSHTDWLAQITPRTEPLDLQELKMSAESNNKSNIEENASSSESELDKLTLSRQNMLVSKWLDTFDEEHVGMAISFPSLQEILLSVPESKVLKHPDIQLNGSTFLTSDKITQLTEPIVRQNITPNMMVEGYINSNNIEKPDYSSTADIIDRVVGWINRDFEYPAKIPKGNISNDVDMLDDDLQPLGESEIEDLEKRYLNLPSDTSNPRPRQHSKDHGLKVEPTMGHESSPEVQNENNTQDLLDHVIVENSQEQNQNNAQSFNQITNEDTREQSQNNLQNPNQDTEEEVEEFENQLTNPSSNSSLTQVLAQGFYRASNSISNSTPSSTIAQIINRIIYFLEDSDRDLRLNQYHFPTDNQHRDLSVNSTTHQPESHDSDNETLHEVIDNSSQNHQDQINQRDFQNSSTETNSVSSERIMREISTERSDAVRARILRELGIYRRHQERSSEHSNNQTDMQEALQINNIIRERLNIDQRSVGNFDQPENVIQTAQRNRRRFRGRIQRNSRHAFQQAFQLRPREDLRHLGNVAIQEDNRLEENASFSSLAVTNRLNNTTNIPQSATTSNATMNQQNLERGTSYQPQIRNPPIVHRLPAQHDPNWDSEYTLAGMTPETIDNLAQYLPVGDLHVVSRVCQKLREPFLAKSWEHVWVLPSHVSAMDSLDSKLRPLSFLMFLPKRLKENDFQRKNFSWVRGDLVKDLVISDQCLGQSVFESTGIEELFSHVFQTSEYNRDLLNNGDRNTAPSKIMAEDAKNHILKLFPNLKSFRLDIMGFSKLYEQSLNRFTSGRDYLKTAFKPNQKAYPLPIYNNQKRAFQAILFQEEEDINSRRFIDVAPLLPFTHVSLNSIKWFQDIADVTIIRELNLTNFAALFEDCIIPPTRHVVASRITTSDDSSDSQYEFGPECNCAQFIKRLCTMKSLEKLSLNPRAIIPFSTYARIMKKVNRENFPKLKQLIYKIQDFQRNAMDSTDDESDIGLSGIFETLGKIDFQRNLKKFHLEVWLTFVCPPHDRISIGISDQIDASNIDSIHIKIHKAYIETPGREWQLKEVRGLRKWKVDNLKCLAVTSDQLIASNPLNRESLAVGLYFLTEPALFFRNRQTPAYLNFFMAHMQGISNGTSNIGYLAKPRNYDYLFNPSIKTTLTTLKVLLTSMEGHLTFLNVIDEFKKLKNLQVSEAYSPPGDNYYEFVQDNEQNIAISQAITNLLYLCKRYLLNWNQYSLIPDHKLLQFYGIPPGTNMPLFERMMLRWQIFRQKLCEEFFYVDPRNRVLFRNHPVNDMIATFTDPELMYPAVLAEHIKKFNKNAARGGLGQQQLTLCNVFWRTTFWEAFYMKVLRLLDLETMRLRGVSHTCESINFDKLVAGNESPPKLSKIYFSMYRRPEDDNNEYCIPSSWLICKYKNYIHKTLTPVFYSGGFGPVPEIVAQSLEYELDVAGYRGTIQINDDISTSDEEERNQNAPENSYMTQQTREDNETPAYSSFHHMRWINENFEQLIGIGSLVHSYPKGNGLQNMDGIDYSHL